MGNGGTPEQSGVPLYKDKVERMFLGRYEHAIDEKGRLTIPARFRELLLNGAYITRGIDENAVVYPASVFESILEQLSHLSFTDPDARELNRLFFSTAERVEVDKVGRMLIPSFLREQYGLTENAMIIGAGRYFEIWAPSAWKTQDEKLRNADENQRRFVDMKLPLG